jgi:hypothetical protein
MDFRGINYLKRQKFRIFLSIKSTIQLKKNQIDEFFPPTFYGNGFHPIRTIILSSSILTSYILRGRGDLNNFPMASLIPVQSVQRMLCPS